jgi:hypothetical protein
MSNYIDEKYEKREKNQKVLIFNEVFFCPWARNPLSQRWAVRNFVFGSGAMENPLPKNIENLL